MNFKVKCMLLYKLHTQLLRVSVVKLKLRRDSGFVHHTGQLDLNTIYNKFREKY